MGVQPPRFLAGLFFVLRECFHRQLTRSLSGPVGKVREVSFSIMTTSRLTTYVLDLSALGDEMGGLGLSDGIICESSSFSLWQCQGKR